MNAMVPNRGYVLSNMIIEKLGGIDSSCYVYIRNKELNISYYWWCADATRKSFTRYYPAESLDMSNIDIVEMFTYDYVFSL